MNPYSLLLAVFGLLISVKIAALLFPVLFGILSVLFIGFLLQKYIKNIKKRAAILLLFILSPVFIYTFSASSLSFLFFIFVISFFLLSLRNSYSLLSMVSFLFIPFFGLLHVLIVLCFLVVFYLLTKIEKNHFFASVLILLVSSIVLKVSFSVKNSVIVLDFFKLFLSDLGAQAGFSIFLLLLTAIGLIVTWKFKYKLWPLYILFIVLTVFSLFIDNVSNIYLNILFCIFAGAGIDYLFKMRWQLKFIKKAAIFLLFLGIIFSATSYDSRVASSSPSIEFIEGINFLEEYDLNQGVVLSHPKNGFVIGYFSELPVVIDSNYYTTKHGRFVKDDIEIIFKTKHMRDVLPLLQKYKIRYVVIDGSMGNGLVWNRLDQGLLFLLQNSEKFKNIYTDTGVEVWEYIGKYDLEGEK